MITKRMHSNWMMPLSVASVLFGWHAGGGFATGNQANQFYVTTGWFGPFSAVLAILLLTLAVRQAMIMYRQRDLSSYKQLFQALYHPFGWLEAVFEAYFYIMILMATSASIAGAGMLFVDIMDIPYLGAVVIISVLLLSMTMFGANLVRRVSAIMSALILACALSIFIVGIVQKGNAVGAIFTAGPDIRLLPKAILHSFQYAGFQCAAIPTMIACDAMLSTERSARRSMWISFGMNSIALCLSVVMLLGWQSVYAAVDGGSVIPTLTVCKQLGVPALAWAYYICLFLCFISTGVASVFGLVGRFANAKALRKIRSAPVRNAIVAALVMTLSMVVSFAGLTNIVRYGYGYCGYIGITIVVVPFLTVGVYKNRRYRAKHPEIEETFPAKQNADEGTVTDSVRLAQ